MQARAAEVQHALRRSLRSFKVFPRVNCWLRKYVGRLQGRKRFLVLTGPSGVGKTEYARCLFKAHEVLELNCAGLEHICLSSFDPEEHKCILWDELSAHVIARNRKLFQHPACFVDVGHSPTGQFVQHLWLNNAVSIVATNRWHEDIQSTTSESDRSWFKLNAVVQEVQEPMWEN